MSEAINPTANADLRIGLLALATLIRSWLDWDRKLRSENKPPLTTDDGTHIMALPVPFWPSHGAFENWIKLFQRSSSALEKSELIEEWRAARQDVFDNPSKITDENAARWKRMSDAETALMDYARSASGARP